MDNTWLVFERGNTHIRINKNHIVRIAQNTVIPDTYNCTLYLTDGSRFMCWLDEITAII